MGQCEFSERNLWTSYPELTLAPFRTAPLFAAGIELRQKVHQQWLMDVLGERIRETGFHAVRFLRDGLRFAYAKLDGLRGGLYVNIKEGAAARYADTSLPFLKGRMESDTWTNDELVDRIDGVSENLWSAEGMLRSMEALSLYDSEPATPRRNFQGDYSSDIAYEDELPYENSPISRASTTMERPRTRSSGISLRVEGAELELGTPSPLMPSPLVRMVSPSPSPLWSHQGDFDVSEVTSPGWAEMEQFVGLEGDLGWDWWEEWQGEAGGDMGSRSAVKEEERRRKRWKSDSPEAEPGT